MATVFLHVGVAGTGSADIRARLRTQQGELRSRGVSFPGVGRDGETHDALARWLRTLSEDENPQALPLGRALCEEIAASEVSILSSDRFSDLSSRALHNLARLTAGHSVVVVIYLREHLTFWMHKYERAVVSSNLSTGFDAYCQLAKAPFGAMVDRFAEVFAPENIRLRSCDRLAAPDGDIVADFALATGCHAVTQGWSGPVSQPPRVTGNLLFVKRVLNTFLDRRKAARLASDVEALALLEPDARWFFVDQATARRVAEMYAADRIRLARRYGLEIEPWVGSCGAMPSPDLATLQADWARLRALAEQRGLPLARLMAVVSPRSARFDAAATAAPGSVIAGMSKAHAMAALRQLATRIAALEDEATSALAPIELTRQLDTLKRSLHELHTGATVDLRRRIADYAHALDAALRTGESLNPTP